MPGCRGGWSEDGLCVVSERGGVAVCSVELHVCNRRVHCPALSCLCSRACCFCARALYTRFVDIFAPTSLTIGDVQQIGIWFRVCPELQGTGTPSLLGLLPLSVVFCGLFGGIAGCIW